MNKGVLFAVSAYVFWGLHPIYWKQLQHVLSVEIVSHRILWSLNKSEPDRRISETGKDKK